MVYIREVYEQDFEFSELFSETPNRKAVVNEFGETVGLISYEVFDTDEPYASVNTIEMFYEGCGYGSEVIKTVFESTGVNLIVGESLNSALTFWKAIGAKSLGGDVLIKDGYHKEFQLSRSDFENYYFRQTSDIGEVDSPSIKNPNLQPINTDWLK